MNSRNELLTSGYANLGHGFTHSVCVLSVNLDLIHGVCTQARNHVLAIKFTESYTTRADIEDRCGFDVPIIDMEPLSTSPVGTSEPSHRQGIGSATVLIDGYVFR